MWKTFFEFCDYLFALVPVQKWRKYLREYVLFDYRRKLNALQRAYPELNFKTMRLAKGGGSLVFILNNKYNFKVRKRNHETINFDRFIREKRITDALRSACNIQIPNIDLVKIGDYTFYKSDFIPGKLLVDIPSYKIKKYQHQISKQLAEFIYKKSSADPKEIEDLRGKKQPNYSWVHGDMCSNILVNPKNMVITGIIDWEWCTYQPTDYEFVGLVRVRKKMRKLQLDKTTEQCYNKIVKKHK